MLRYSYGKRLLVEESQRISAGVFIRNCLIESGKLIKDFDLKDEVSILDLIKRIERGASLNLKQEKSGKIEYSEPNKVKLTYTKSNLGKGFILWFVCNVCGNKVRHLYFPPNSSILACRKCHGLAYTNQNDSKSIRSLNRQFKL